jgi:TetR/AcrR family transcriptional regulator
MKEQDYNTEEKILDAAVDEFIEHGRSGARMQEIADRAGINKALLHYYFRSKDLLFEAVFSQVIKRLLLPRLIAIIEEESDLFEMIRKFTGIYMEVLNNNPRLPFFILDEIRKNPTRLSNAILKSELPVDKLHHTVHKAIENGLIRPCDPRHIFVNLISLCVFPLLGRNLLQAVLFNNHTEDFDRFLESRKSEVAEFIIRSIQTQNR